MANTEIPGVYTSYEVSNYITSSQTADTIGLAAAVYQAMDEDTYTISSYAQAKTLFGDCPMTTLISQIIKNGAAKIIAIPLTCESTAVPTTAAYTTAFSSLMANTEPKYLICDSRLTAVHGAMKTAILSSTSEATKYRIGIVEFAGSVSEIEEACEDLNSERMVLIALDEDNSEENGAFSASFAAICATTSDPALPFNGAELVDANIGALCFSDAEMSTLITAGATVLENLNGTTSVVRAVTTKTATDGVDDYTWRELNTILIVDEVIPEIRDTLKLMFSRTKNTAQTRSAIKTQVLILLEKYLAAEIIDSYGDIAVTADSDDGTVCNIDFSFAVAHGLNKINLVAYITV